VSGLVWFLVGVAVGAPVVVIGGFAIVCAIAGIVDRIKAERHG